MSRKIFSFFMALAVLFTTAFALSGCGEKSEYPVTVGSVTINSQPQHIVILSKNLADVVTCIGYDINMVGRSDEVTQEGLQVVPSVGSCTSPDIKKVKKAQADIVLADSSLTEAAKEEFEKEGIPVVIIDDAQTPKQVKYLYKKVGTVLGGNVTGQSNAKKAISDLFDTMKDIKAAVTTDSIVKTMCYLYVDNGVLKTMNNGTWGATMLGFTGAVNVFKNNEGNVVDTETLTLSNPDCIFCADEEVVNYLKTSDTFSKLNALENNTYVIKYDDINMQGYTALDVLQVMIKDMYPEQFSE